MGEVRVITILYDLRNQLRCPAHFRDPSDCKLKITEGWVRARSHCRSLRTLPEYHDVPVAASDKSWPDLSGMGNSSVDVRDLEALWCKLN